MPSPNDNRAIWWGLALGALGAVRVWSMAITGTAQLPHIVAVLTLLVPLVVFGVLIRSIWPAAAGLAIVVIIELSLM